jgi:hypothetical protein
MKENRMGILSHGVKILESAGYKLLNVGESVDTFTKKNEDDSITFLDIDKKNGSFSVFTQYKDEVIVYDLPIDVAVGIVEFVKGLGI